MRRFHLINVSLPRTGTRSIAGLFSHYRAGHEYQLLASAQMLQGYIRGDVGQDQLRAFLLKRDALVEIEVDSAFFHNWFADELVDLFPDARFLIVLREPLSWADSVLAFGRERVREARRLGLPPPPILAFFAEICGVDFDPDVFVTLESHPDAVASYTSELLRVWHDRNAHVLGVVPEERRLVLGTAGLSQSHRLLADFVGVDPETMRVDVGHINTRLDGDEPLIGRDREPWRDGAGEQAFRLWSEASELIATG